MKFIPLQAREPKYAIVDDEWYEVLRTFKWHLTSYRYAVTTVYASGKNFSFRMHSVIIPAQKGLHIDHINGNGLDNRLENLRIATPSQNQFNVGRRVNNTSGYKGVYFQKYKGGGYWKVQLRVSGHNHHIGMYPDRVSAARAYDEVARRYHGEFAYQNFPPETKSS